MKQKKRKKMTNREKAERAEVKRELQGMGIIPPDKPRLNRKKFAEEVLAEYELLEAYTAYLYLRKAIGCMVGPDMKEITAEQIGVLKVLKIAVETKKFMEALKSEGQTQYTLGEYLDKVVLPITRL